MKCWKVAGELVSHAKGHHQILEGTIARTEHYLPLMSRHYAHVVVTRVQVNLGKDLCGVQAVQEITNEREWVAVLARDAVQVAVINAKA